MDPSSAGQPACGRANDLAAEANKHAETSAEAAREAVAIARAADERADRIEQRQLERSDVSWEPTYDAERRTISFQNVGSDVAHNVEALIDHADGKFAWEQASSPTVPPRHRIGVHLDAWAHDVYDQWQARQGADIFGRPSLHVRARLTWETESGRPRTQIWKDISC